MLTDEITTKIVGKYTEDFKEQLRLKEIIEEVLNDYDISTKCTALVSSDILEKAQYFMATKKLEGMSEGTLKNYKYEFLRLAGKINKTVASITDIDIKVYLSSFESIKKSTLNSRLANLKAFFTWLQDEEYILKNPTKRLKAAKVPKKLREGLTLMELELTREACKNDRERALLEFLASTGCRASEVRNLKIENIDFNKKQARVTGKGNKQRLVFFTDKAKLLLVNYIENRNRDSEFAFTTMKGPVTNLSLRAVEIIINNIAKRTNIPLFPHKLRHTFCSINANKGMDMAVLKELMGHESLETTQRYYSISKSKLESEYKRIS